MKAAVLAVMLFAAAGSAEAQSADALMTAPLRATGKSVAIDLTEGPRMSFGPRYDHAGAPRIPGVAKTSVDRRFDDQGMVGELGFLCGLDPGADLKGATQMRGYDASGRFVGAKLRMAFR